MPYQVRPGLGYAGQAGQQVDPNLWIQLAKMLSQQKQGAMNGDWAGETNNPATFAAAPGFEGMAGAGTSAATDAVAAAAAQAAASAGAAGAAESLD